EQTIQQRHGDSPSTILFLDHEYLNGTYPCCLPSSQNFIRNVFGFTAIDEANYSSVELCYQEEIRLGRVEALNVRFCRGGVPCSILLRELENSDPIFLLVSSN